MYKEKIIANLQSKLKTLFDGNIPSHVEDDTEPCIPSQGKEHTVFFPRHIQTHPLAMESCLFSVLETVILLLLSTNP